MLSKTTILLIRLFCLSALCVYLTACGEDKVEEHPLYDYVEQVKSRNPGPVDAIPEMKTHPKHTYSAEDIRDPFKPVVKRAAGGSIVPDQNRSKQPLEAFPLDSLRMVGILEGGQQMWALVTAADGTVYRAGIGDYLGQNYGRIVKITPEEIKIIEIVQIGEDWKHQTATMSLIEEGDLS